MRFRAKSLVTGMLAVLSGVVPPTSSAERPVNERIPFESEFFNACTGETVFVEGTIHVLARDQHFHTNFVGHGRTASGVKYVVTDVRNESPNVDVTPDPRGAEATTFGMVVHLTRQGSETPADDSWNRLTFHATENASGEPTVVWTKGDFGCR